MLIGSLLLVTSLCAQCGPSVEPSTTKAIIQVESGGNPYAIGDNTLKKSFSPNTREEAVQLASCLLAQGHNLDMGLMQVNSIHLKTGAFPLADLFDPCRNIAIGTGILTDFYRRNDRGEARNVVLFKALSAYNTGSAWRGPGYINRILKAAGVPYRVAVTNSPPARKESTVSANGARDLRQKAAGSHSQAPDSTTLFFPGTSRLGEAHGL
jgi:type IV secretion system protein VirB1